MKKDEEISFKFILYTTYEYLDINDELNELKFEIYCVDASYGMKDLLTISPYSIILTSGTLCIDSMENLLQIKFKEVLQNEHIIKKERLLAHIIKSITINNITYNFDFSFKNRKDINQIILLGNEIYNLTKSVKLGGILVFFPSYDFLNECYKIWLNIDFIKKFKSLKTIIFDLFIFKESNEFLIEDEKKKNNLLLFTVHRGKNSEGINFPKDQARMVICVGIPFSNLNDIKVQLKMDFLNEKNKKEKEGLKGWNWYKQDSLIAVNQSLGRLIRDKDDYGIMICFGNEFKGNKYMLSNWIKNNVVFIDLDENKEKYYKKIEDFLINLKTKENNSFNIKNDYLDKLSEEEDEEEIIKKDEEEMEDYEL